LGVGQTDVQLPVSERLSVPVNTGSGAHTAPCTKDIGPFLGVKQPECGAGHTLSSSADVPKILKLYLYLPSVTE